MYLGSVSSVFKFDISVIAKCVSRMYLVWTSLGIIFVLRSLYSKFNGDVLHIQVPWDGYLKYFQPKPEYKANRYTIFGPHGLVFAHIAFFSGSSTSQFCSSV